MPDSSDANRLSDAEYDRLDTLTTAQYCLAVIDLFRSGRATCCMWFAMADAVLACAEGDGALMELVAPIERAVLGVIDDSSQPEG